VHLKKPSWSPLNFENDSPFNTKWWPGNQHSWQTNKKKELSSSSQDQESDACISAHSKISKHLSVGFIYVRFYFKDMKDLFIEKKKLGWEDMVLVARATSTAQVEQNFD
jgi:hypothetical protein